MKTVYLILYIVAAVLFAIAIFTPSTAAHPLARVNLIAAGLLAWVAVPLIHQIDIMNN